MLDKEKKKQTEDFIQNDDYSALRERLRSYMDNGLSNLNI